MSRLKDAFQMLKEKARVLKREVKVLYLAYKRPDVPWYAKLFALLVVGYALSPIDLIPDFIPVLGYLDDLVLIPLGVSIALRMIPHNVVEECRAQADEVFKDGKPKNWVAGAVIIMIWLAVIILIISATGCSTGQKAAQPDNTASGQEAVEASNPAELPDPVEYTVNILDSDSGETIDEAYVSILEEKKKYRITPDLNKILLPAVESTDPGKYPYGYSMVTMAEGYLPRIDHSFVSASSVITLELKRCPAEPSNEAYTEFFHGAAMNEVAGLLGYYEALPAETGKRAYREENKKIGEMANGVVVFYSEDNVVLLGSSKEQKVIVDELVSCPAISPDQKCFVYVAGEMDYPRYISLYDIEAMKSKILFETDYSNGMNTPKAAAWLNNRYLLVIVGYAYGTVNLGGNLYAYDMEDGKMTLIFAAGEKSEFLDVRINGDQVVLKVMDWQDDQKMEYTVRQEKHSCNEVLGRLGK